MDGNKEEPMTELGLAIGPGNQSTPAGSNKDLGTGANAGPKEEMIFVTATSLSELVWSPRKGVSLKCADSSLPDKKFSFLCGVGLNNMVCSPPQSITSKERNYVHVDEEKVSSLPMKSHLACKVSEEVRLVKSPKSTAGITPICWTTSHEHNLGSSGSVKDMASKVKLSALNIDRESNHSDKEEKEICCQTAKASIPGTSSGPVVVARDVGSGNSHIAGMQGALSSEVSKVEQCKLFDTQNALITSHESKKEELAPYIEGDDKDKNNEIGSIPSLGKQESTAENDLQTLTGEGAYTEVDLIEQHPADEGTRCDL